MTFLEAAKELDNARCKAIARKGWLRDNMTSKTDHMTFHDAYSSDWYLVDPVQQFEEVEVVQWMCKDCTSCYDIEHQAKCCPCGYTGKPVRLTGTYNKPIKPKVKRREQINIRAATGWEFKVFESQTLYHNQYKFFAEWEE